LPVASLTGVQLGTLVWLFALGCVVGSFLNVCIWRLPLGMGISEPRRSVCPHCRAPIRWHDNVPLLSFFLLRGRCRACGARISWRYPAVEGLTGLLFALIYFRQGVQAGAGPGQLVLMMLLASLLIVASAVDAEWLIIPDEISIFGLAAGLLAGLLLPQLHVGTASYNTFRSLTGRAHLDGLIGSAVGAAAGGGLVLVFAALGAALFRKEALGFGDVKLMAMVGAFFGWKVAVMAFFFAPFFGLLYGLPLLVLSDEHVMPFGPFLSAGAVLALVFRTSVCAFLQPLEDLAHVLVS